MFGSHPPRYLRPLCTVRMAMSSLPSFSIIRSKIKNVKGEYEHFPKKSLFYPEIIENMHIINVKLDVKYYILRIYPIQSF